MHLKKSATTGRLLRSTAGHLVNECDSPCHPCIPGVQGEASLAISGGCLSRPWEESGLIQRHPDHLVWCSAWDQSGWPGDCCWAWANYDDISDVIGVPGWIFNWVLIVCYDAGSETFSAGVYVGSDFDDGDPCTWLVGDTPAFVSTAIATNQADDPNNYLECGPDEKLHGRLTMTGQDSGWGGGDATDCTATVTL